MSDANLLLEKNAAVATITFNNPKALNALTWKMCLENERALDRWANDASLDLLVIDAVGDRAFCAGGDIQEMYERGRAGDFAYGERFWRDEYRMNAKLFRFPKPVVTLMQGFTMGGGVGVGCHGSHRVVGDTSRIAMPECGIGLVPDVGGSLILARAPGRFAVVDEAACSLRAEGFIARCEVGEGIVLMVADADFAMEEGAPGETNRAFLLGLIEGLAE